MPKSAGEKRRRKNRLIRLRSTPEGREKLRSERRAQLARARSDPERLKLLRASKRKQYLNALSRAGRTSKKYSMLLRNLATIINPPPPPPQPSPMMTAIATADKERHQLHMRRKARRRRMERIRSDPVRMAHYKMSKKQSKKRKFKRWRSTHEGRLKIKLKNAKDRNTPTDRIRRSQRNIIKRCVTSLSVSTSKRVGCSMVQLRAYLESQFISHMSWSNYGRAWHIDHIIPLASFDLSSESEIKKACHYTNLRPLWAKANIRKGDKITVKEFQPMLILQ